MAYDPFLRKRRSLNEPLVPIPNYIPPMGSGATVGELDQGVARQTQFNKGLFAPGGLAPYYGASSYTQRAQQSKPMTPMFSGGMPVLRRPVSDAVPGAPVPDTAPINYAGNVVGGMNYEGGPIAATPSVGITQPPGNSTQRWQGGTSLDQRPPPQPFFTPGQLRRGYTGRIGGTAMPSPRDRPLGFTPQGAWDDQFKPRLRGRTPGSARGANGRAPYLWET